MPNACLTATATRDNGGICPNLKARTALFFLQGVQLHSSVQVAIIILFLIVVITSGAYTRKTPYRFQYEAI